MRYALAQSNGFTTFRIFYERFTCRTRKPQVEHDHGRRDGLNFQVNIIVKRLLKQRNDFTTDKWLLLRKHFWGSNSLYHPCIQFVTSWDFFSSTGSQLLPLRPFKSIKKIFFQIDNMILYSSLHSEFVTQPLKVYRLHSSSWEQFLSLHWRIMIFKY